jgi:WD40 repeat protein
VTAAAPAPASPAAGGQVDRDNPWPGLPSFREQDQEFFFGREAEIEELRRTVMRESTRATVLFGRSGLGKTSLLQAGLFPRLRRQEVLPVPIRLAWAGERGPGEREPGEPGAGERSQEEREPGEPGAGERGQGERGQVEHGPVEHGPVERGLVEQVRQAILAAAADAGVEPPSFLPGETLWESLHRAGANFWSAANRIVVPLLVFDQFEEIFTLGRKDPGREAFLAELGDLVEGRPPASVKERLDGEPALAAGFSPERHDYKVLLCLRQDFLADLDTLRARMRSLGASRLALLHMNGEAALRVVTRAGGHLIEPEVAEKVVRFVAGAGRQSPGGAGGPAGAGSAAAAEREGAGGRGNPAVREGAPLREKVAAHRDAAGRESAAAGSPALAERAGASRQAGAAGGGLAPLAELEVDPTLLSLVCRELNNRRRERGEPRITFDLLSGSWKEILTRFYEDSLAGLAPELRTFIEDRLLTRSGYRDSVAWDNAVAEPGVTAADLLTLRDRRLLRIEERHGADWIELTHDVLTEVIGESRELRRQRDARRKAEEALREADERERLARERERETRRLLARSRRLAVVLGWVLLAAVLLAIASAVLWRHSDLAERIAESAQRRAERALFDSAGNLIEKGRAAQALAYLASIMRSSPEDSGNARSRALDILLHESWPLPVRVVRHARAVTAAELSPDGERLLTASLDGTARLWRVGDGASLGVMRPGGAVVSAAFSPGGARVLTGSRDGAVRIWDGRSGAPIGGEMRVLPPLFEVEWSPRGDQLRVSSLEGVTAWDAGTLERLTPPHTGVVAVGPHGERLLAGSPAGAPPEAQSTIDPRASGGAGSLAIARQDAVLAAFNHRGDRLLAVGVQGTVRVWDPAARRVVSTLEHKAPVTWAEFSPDDRTLLTVCADRVVRLWNLDPPGPPAALLQHDRYVYAAHFSPDGRWVLTGSRDAAARLWDARTGEPAVQPLLHTAPVNTVGFSRDGRRAVTAADDGVAKVWDLRPDRYARPQQLPQPARFAFFGPRGAEVVAVLRDGTARLWDLATGASRGVSPGERKVLSANPLADGRVALVALDPQGTLRAWDAGTGQAMSAAIKDPAVPDLVLAQVSADGERVLALRLGSAGGPEIEDWDARTGRKIAGIAAPGERFAALSDDGRLVLTRSESGVHLRDTRTGGKVAEIGQAHVVSAVFSPHAGLVAIYSADQVLRFFEPSGRRTGVSLPFDSGLGALRFSRDATRLVATLGRGEIEVREVASGRLLCRIHLPSEADPLAAEAPDVADLSPDGKRFLARSPEGFAQVWDVESCQQLTEPLWHPLPRSWVASDRFSPDGARILTVDNDGSARVWDLPATSTADSAALADLAEAVGGFAVDAAGNTAPVEHPVERLDRLRASAARPPGESRIAHQVMRWFFTAPDAITLSPFSSIRISAHSGPPAAAGPPSR